MSHTDEEVSVEFAGASTLQPCNHTNSWNVPKPDESVPRQLSDSLYPEVPKIEVRLSALAHSNTMGSR